MTMAEVFKRIRRYSPSSKAQRALIFVRIRFRRNNAAEARSQRRKCRGNQDKKMDKTVYFVRHAQSLANAGAVFQPPESPLSDKGRRQAACVAARLSKLPLQALVSSSYERARETAGVISQATGLEPSYSDLFVERIKPPAVNGKPLTDEEAHAIWSEWNDSFYMPGVRAGGGENFEDLVARADAALAFLENRAETSIVAVTHGYFLRSMMARAVLGGHLSGENFRNFQRFASTENTALTVMRYRQAAGETGWSVRTYNDYAHLSACD
jgi:broad specificity phosphatase PhoE